LPADRRCCNFPFNRRLRAPEVNYEGVVCTTSPDGNRQCNAYAQLFRDGCIELVGPLSTGEVEQPPAPAIYPAQHELPLVQHGIPMIAQALAALGVPAPVYLFVSLHRRDAVYVTVCRPGTHHAENRPLPPHLTDLLSPPVYVEDLGVPAAELMAPALDPLWNAVGLDHTQTNFAGGRRMTGQLRFPALSAMPCRASHRACRPRVTRASRLARVDRARTVSCVIGCAPIRPGAPR
jgi:hypothetical protein